MKNLAPGALDIFPYFLDPPESNQSPMAADPCSPGPWAGFPIPFEPRHPIPGYSNPSSRQLLACAEEGKGKEEMDGFKIE